MSKFLIIGDLHAKIDIFLNIVEEFEKENYDKIIFLGDYCDDWNTSPDASRELLDKLIEFKKKYYTQCILLLGNHDFSEWLGGNFECSGFNYLTHIYCENKFDDNLYLFQIAYAHKDYLFTHAGVTNSWLKKVKKLENEYKDMTTAYRIADRLNQCLYSSIMHEGHYKLFKSLQNIGGYRGGYEYPSPIWTDYHELISNPIPHINQVVGHTPVKTVIKHEFKNSDKSKNILYFCDTHSTYRDGKKYGDDSFLQIEI